MVGRFFAAATVADILWQQVFAVREIFDWRVKKGAV
jgi:hypothetical protein